MSVPTDARPVPGTLWPGEDIFTAVVRVPRSTGATAYGAKDAVGTQMAVAGAVRGPGRGAVLEAVTVIDNAAQKAALELYLFGAIPTEATDNSAYDPTDGDLLLSRGFVAIAATDYTSQLADNAIGTKLPGLPFSLIGDNTTLWLQLITSGTPTYEAGNTDLSLVLTFRRF